MKQEYVLQCIQSTVREVMPEGVRVVLFGSRARGDAREDSDWDLLILLPQKRVAFDDFDNLAYPLIELGWSIGAEINPLLYTMDEWEKRSFTPFYRNIERESIELWH